MWVVLKPASTVVFRQIGGVHRTQSGAYKEAFRMGIDKYKIAKIYSSKNSSPPIAIEDSYIDIPWDWKDRKRHEEPKAAEIFIGYPL